MALGDGIRRNLADVSPEERRRLRDAFVKLNKKLYPGKATDTQFGRPVPGGVTFWFKQDEIHARTGVHGQPIFLPWHRELCNRLERDLREIDPQISLHYWDWTTDPTKQVRNGVTFSLCTPEFMGSAVGVVGEPWLGAGYYNPNANPPRLNNPHVPEYNAALVPREIRRSISPGGSPNTPADDRQVVLADDYPTARGIIEGLHGSAHGYIGGTIANSHTAFRDPFVFLLHANVDRLFALWQLQPGHPERLDPARVYGSEGDGVTEYSGGIETKDGRDFAQDPEDISWGMNAPLHPWSGFEFDAVDLNGQQRHLSLIPIRPWGAPENAHVGHGKTPKDPSIVKPPKYDTNP